MTKRAEQYVGLFHQELSQEFKERLDQNVVGVTDKYEALRRIEELHWKVEDGVLDRSEARAIIERENLDEDAADAVKSMARSAARHAWYQLPEVKAVRKIPKLASQEVDKKEREFRVPLPKPNASFSYSHGKPEVRVSVRWGSFYKMRYSTDEHTFDHSFTWREGAWSFQGGIEHKLDDFISAKASVNYFFSERTSVGFNYLYQHEERTHIGAMGFFHKF